MTKIPKIIHYMWLGDKPKSDETLKYIESWKKHNPDYKIMEWNESNIQLDSCPFMKETIENKKYGFTSDWVRLYALKKYGGIYLDTDVEVVKNFDDLLELDGFLSFENEAHVQSAVMASKKDSKWINDLFDYYSVRHYVVNNKIDYTSLPVIQSIYLHKFHNLKYKNSKQKLDNILTAFPCDYFSPKDYTTEKITITDNTYAIHNFAASWFSKKAKVLAKFLKGIRYIFGKKIFGCFTRIYVKSLEKKYYNEMKNVFNSKKDSKN